MSRIESFEIRKNKLEVWRLNTCNLCGGKGFLIIKKQFSSKKIETCCFCQSIIDEDEKIMNLIEIIDYFKKQEYDLIL